MNTGNISTYALNTAARFQTNKLRQEFVEAQKEVSTGRKADVGYSLGPRSSTLVSVEFQISSITQISETNSIVENRMSTMQLSMKSIINSADELISVATTELNGALEGDLLQRMASSALGGVTSLLNVTLGGEYLFSGVNSDSLALNDYQDPAGSAAKSAVQAAFVNEFGFPVDDLAAETITPAALKGFIDGAFNDLFDDANWQALWTGSSQRGMRAKISSREIIENPLTANDTAFRNITAGAVMLEEFSNGKLNPSALDELVNSSIQILAKSIQEVGTEQSKLGVLEERVSNASERMSFQKGILASQLSNLTEVDSYEAVTRLNQLALGLESSYASTVKIQSLSILNYI